MPSIPAFEVRGGRLRDAERRRVDRGPAECPRRPGQGIAQLAIECESITLVVMQPRVLSQPGTDLLGHVHEWRDARRFHPVDPNHQPAIGSLDALGEESAGLGLEHGGRRRRISLPVAREVVRHHRHIAARTAEAGRCRFECRTVPHGHAHTVGGLAHALVPRCCQRGILALGFGQRRLVDEHDAQGRAVRSFEHVAILLIVTQQVDLARFRVGPLEVRGSDREILGDRAAQQPGGLDPQSHVIGTEARLQLLVELPRRQLLAHGGHRSLDSTGLGHARQAPALRVELPARAEEGIPLERGFGLGSGHHDPGPLRLEREQLQSDHGLE